MEQIQQRFGNYRLIQLLGKGTFADVYLGEHLYLNTPVAIKVLRSKIDSPNLAGFLNEARQVSHLVHPHIIRVVDFGLESVAPFLVMDYAPYGNLRKPHPLGSVLPISTIVSYTMALASALQCAHDQHLVHRDLKPENILLGSKHEVLLSDFGLALLASDQELLLVKERFGTLSYMAPELILGRPVPASDQYALAVMVYEWLCGHPPFTGSSAHISNQHLYAVPPSLCEEHPEIPRAVEQVVLKGLSKEPAQRFVDVLSFARAFEEACYSYTATNALSNLSALSFESSSHLDELPLQFQHIPLPLTPLIGREPELHTLRDLLLRPEVRLVTLTGAGGIGKTHLALALGHEFQDTFASGVTFISLASIYDSELVLPAIVHALGLKELGDRSPMQILKTFLHDKNLLIVIDNFEQVLPSAPHLSDLLSSCSQLKILVTSRSVLHVWGEYIFRVQPLEVPDPQQLPELDSLSQIASIALFVQRAEAILPEFKLTDEIARDVAEICKRLDGVPLALELAATYCKLLSPKAILIRLKHPVEMLTGGRRDAPLRHQTLHNMLSWNEDLLAPDEHKLFRRLSIFDGEFSLHAAEAIMNIFGDINISVLDCISALIDKSMLQQTTYDKEETRLYFLEVLRDYGLELLAACGELQQTRDAHAAYFLALTEAIVFDSNQAIWQKRLQCDVTNVRAAVEWLMERGERGKALRIVAALGKVSEVSQKDNVLFLSQVDSDVSEVANYHVLSQFDTDLKDVRFEKYECLNKLSDDQQEIVINLNFMEHMIPLRQNRMDESTILSSSPYGELTTREIEVLRLLSMGLSNKQIAERLVLSPHTVSGHIQSIFGKLALNSRSAATRYALEHHLA